MRTLVWVSWRYLQRRRTTSLALCASSLVLSATLVVLATLSAQVAHSLDDSVRLSQGGYRYAISTSSPAVVDAMRAGHTAVPVVDRGSATVTSSSGRSSTAALRSSATPVHVGRLVGGRSAASAGQAVLSRALAAALHVSLGARVRVDGGGGATARVRVVGLSVDPLRPQSRRADVRVAAAALAPATLWLSDTDPSAQPWSTQLEGQYSQASVPQGFGDANADPVAALTGVLHDAVWLVAVVGLCLLLVLLTSLRARSAADVEALSAIGCPRARAWLLLHATWGACQGGGVVLGAVLASVVVTWLAGPLGAVFGQAWTHPVLAPSAWVVAASFLVALPGLTSAALSVRAIPERPVRGAGRRLERLAALARWCCALVGVASASALALEAVTIWSGHGHRWGAAYGAAPLLGALALLAMPVTLRTVVTAGAPRTTRRVLTGLARPLTRAVLLTAVVLFAGGMWSLVLDRTAVDNSTHTAASDVLQVVDAPRAQVSDLLATYRADGGRGYDVLVEPSQDAEHPPPLTAASTTVACIASARDQGARDVCDTADDTDTSIMISDDPRYRGGVYAPSSIPVRGSTVGAVSVDGRGRVRTALLLTGVHARSALADRASALVVGADSPAARRLGLVASPRDAVLLDDYSSLDRTQQSDLRSSLYTSLPTAFPQFSTPQGSESLRAIAVTGALGLGLLAVLLVGLSTASAREATRATRGLVEQLATTTANRPFKRVFWLPTAVTAVFVAGVTACSGWVVMPHDGHGIGWTWAVPLALLGLLAAAQAWAFRTSDA